MSKFLTDRNEICDATYLFSAKGITKGKEIRWIHSWNKYGAEDWHASGLNISVKEMSANSLAED